MKRLVLQTVVPDWRSSDSKQTWTWSLSLWSGGGSLSWEIVAGSWTLTEVSGSFVGQEQDVVGAVWLNMECVNEVEVGSDELPEFCKYVVNIHLNCQEIKSLLLVSSSSFSSESRLPACRSSTSVSPHSPCIWMSRGGEGGAGGGVGVLSEWAPPRAAGSVFNGPARSAGVCEILCLSVYFLLRLLAVCEAELAPSLVTSQCRREGRPPAPNCFFFKDAAAEGGAHWLQPGL